MPVPNNIEPVTVLKTRAAELIKRARDAGEPIVITQNGKATAVLVDADSYRRQRDALAMLALLAQGDQDQATERVLSHAVAKARLAKRLETRRSGD